MYRLLFFLAILLCFSCNQGTDAKNPNRFEIVEFKHVIETETYSGNEYSYYSGELDSIEVEVLIELFDKNKIVYYVSNEGKLFYDPRYISNIGHEFVIDRELLDTITNRNLPKSKFLAEGMYLNRID